MSEIVLISDTSCDLNPNTIAKYNIQLVPFYVSFDQVEYYKEIEELPIVEFYKRMRADKIFPKTSLPSISDYYDTFKPFIENGKPVICVCLSNFFSGSYNSAVNARELILENYPNAQIEIINSLNATGGQGLLVTEIGRMIQNDVDFSTILATIPKLIEKARIFFYVDTLDYLEHSGRIGKASALLGTMLNVKPIIYLENGQLFPVTKVRGKKKAMSKVLELANNYIEDKNENYNFIVGHADNEDDAVKISEQFKEVIGDYLPKQFFFIGTTIGVNTGPDAAGVCIIPKYETLI